MTTWDGFYAGYMHSSGGQGFAMFVFREGVIAGADPLGVEFDGHYAVREDGSMAGHVSVVVPPNTTLIQGVTTGASGMKYDVPIDLPSGAFEAPFVRLDTPLGPVNLRMQKLRAAGKEE